MIVTNETVKPLNCNFTHSQFIDFRHFRWSVITILVASKSQSWHVTWDTVSVYNNPVCSNYLFMGTYCTWNICRHELSYVCVCATFHHYFQQGFVKSSYWASWTYLGHDSSTCCSFGKGGAQEVQEEGPLARNYCSLGQWGIYFLFGVFTDLTRKTYLKHSKTIPNSLYERYGCIVPLQSFRTILK